MCGIFGYMGQKTAAPIVRQGLKNLDYRGYDSWGVVAANRGKLSVVKQVGIIPDRLPKKILGHQALGHTRWATHGGVSQVNAHPHLSTAGEFALVHNGIVENMAGLKKQLLKLGYQFVSQTDSEVIVRLIESINSGDLITDLPQAASQLSGRNTIAMLTSDGRMLAVKKGSPLVLGRGKKDNYFLSSDTLSFAGQASEFLVVEDGQLLQIKARKVELIDSSTQKQLVLNWQPLKLSFEQAELKEKHFMIQEIKQTPAAIKALCLQPEKSYTQLAQMIKKANRVFTIGSGTAGLAAAQTAYYLRRYAGINAVSLIGAESVSYYRFFDKQSLLIAPSQSGETADVLEVLELAKSRGASTVSQVNMLGSSMSRLSDIAFLAEAGPEKCVMSTKIFSSQIAWGYLVAKSVAQEAKSARDELGRVAVKLDQILNDSKWHEQIKGMVGNFTKVDDIYLMATADLLAIAQEGMVKLIEGTYKHAHAIAAGDLKHYVITLMEPGAQVIVLTQAKGEPGELILNAATEVKTRGATVHVIGPSSLDLADNYLAVPDLGELQALASILPLQLFSYYLADKLGRPVDKPRNIAKSVTVK